jgi:hypothetical protein
VILGGIDPFLLTTSLSLPKKLRSAWLKDVKDDLVSIYSGIEMMHARMGRSWLCR